MNLKTVKKIVEETLPKIEHYYGLSKFHHRFPLVDYQTSIYGRLSGEEDDGTMGEQSPDAEYCSIGNIMFIYYPNMKSKKHIIETLIHEYQHYLQSPSWMKRYYNMGYTYDNHPYELSALKEEKNYKLFK